MAEDKPEKPRGSCLRKLFGLFMVAGIVGLGVAVAMIYQPQDLSDIKGYGPSAASRHGADLTTVLKKSMNGNYPVNLTEDEINLYLRDRLQLKQGGFLSSIADLKGVAVRLTKDRAEVVLERSLFGRRFTTSMYLHVESIKEVNGRISKEVSMDGGQYFADFPRLKRGGRLGKLEVPQGFLLLVLPSYQKLAEALKQEISASVGDMPRVVIKDHSVQFDPREEGDMKPLSHF